MKKFLLLSILLVSLTEGFPQKGWNFQNSNLTNNRFGAIYPINKDTLFVISDSGKVLKTFNGGINWVSQNTGYKVYFFDISFCNADTGYAVGEKGTIIRTTNGGASWTSLSSGTNKDLFSISTKTSGNLWAVGDSGVILNSINHGTTWIKNNSLTTKPLNSVCFWNANTGFIAGNTGTLLGTTNGGASWNTISISTTQDLFSLAVTDNYAYLFAGMTAGHTMLMANYLYKTSNNTTWTGQSASAFGYGTSGIHFSNDSTGYLIGSGCTTNGACVIFIFKTKNYAQTWISSLYCSAPTMALPGMAYSDIMFATDSVGYALSGNYILKTMDAGVFVSVHELNNDQDLSIYPNPFSDKTILQLDYPLQNATLTLYNSFGQVVKQMENLSGQTIALQRDDLPSGLYFLRLTEGNKVFATEKLVITDN